MSFKSNTILSLIDEPYRTTLKDSVSPSLDFSIYDIVKKLDSDSVISEILNGSFDNINSKKVLAYLQCFSNAVETALEGNYGIGSVIVNSNWDVITNGKNRVFEQNYPLAFVSHAEMDCIHNHLINHPSDVLSNYTIVSSLEPCPMCSIGILNSGIKSVHIGSLDTLGGWPVSNTSNIIPVFKELFSTTKYVVDDIPAVLKSALLDIFYLTKDQLDKDLS